MSTEMAAPKSAAHLLWYRKEGRQPAPNTGSGCRRPSPHSRDGAGAGPGPTWGVGDRGVEAAEVDEGVGAEEEVGDDGGDGVELGC